MLVCNLIPHLPIALATTTDNNLLISIEFPIPLFLLYFQILIITHIFVYTINTIIVLFYKLKLNNNSVCSGVSTISNRLS